MTYMDLVTPGGVWNPILFIVFLSIVGFISYLIYRWGEGDVSPEKGSKPFLSGNPEISKEAHRMSGSNLYWGLFESMEKYYELMKKMHSGLINDYIFWFLLVIVALFLILIGGL